jgi:diguanylate cyclase (GGDEF)-like protein/PAS domain S-box-containing protein
MHMQIHNQTVTGCTDGTTPEPDAGAHPDQQEPSLHPLHAEIARLNKIIQALTKENPVRHPADELEAVLLESEIVIRALRESEAHFRQLFERHSAVMLLIDPQSHIVVDANPAAAQFYGYPLKSLRGMNVSRINAQPESEIHPQRQRAIIGEQNRFDFYHRLANGVVRAVEVHISTVNCQGESLFFSIIHDITERKQAEEKLRIAAVTFETHDAILITDANANITRVNQAFQNITGYSSEEVLGKNPRILSSDRQDKAFYAVMWQQLLNTGSWTGEMWDRRKNGEIYPKWLAITAVKDAQGKTTEYVGIFSDITARKQAEEKIQQLALHDPLTQLPNRRLLNDRLEQTMASSKRSGRYGALIFLDLDNFKPLNDTHGHGVGDLLLMEVARRISSCVREVDTVARFGGDEFVVILSELDSDKTESLAQASIVAEKIRAILAEPYVLTIQQEDKAETLTVEHHCTSSIGIMLFIGYEAGAEDVLKWADMAMYQAKKDGRNLIRLYDSKA